MKKIFSTVLATALIVAALAGCGGNNNNGASGSASGSTSGSTSGSSSQASNFKSEMEITVVTREEGSGTRGAFVELLGIEEKGADGTKTDKTTDEAVTAMKTDIMLTNISGDEYAIGYVSMGSLNDSIKALSVDGIAPTTENVKSGAYKIARPFNIATKGAPTGVAKDFMDFILSAQGQDVVASSYIKITETGAEFKTSGASGKIVVAGSSSVNPIMEKLKEAYLALNPAAEIEIQQNDSTAGLTSAAEGTCDIGMASRALKDSEKETLTAVEIAMDGIAVIVNNANPATDISADMVKQIFTGAVTTWDATK